MKRNSFITRSLITLAFVPTIALGLLGTAAPSYASGCDQTKLAKAHNEAGAAMSSLSVAYVLTSNLNAYKGYQEEANVYNLTKDCNNLTSAYSHAWKGFDAAYAYDMTPPIDKQPMAVAALNHANNALLTLQGMVAPK